MRKPNKMRNQIDAITKYLLAALMAILVVDVIWQVFSRYILQSPSTFTDELSRFLLIWVSLLGAAYASGQKMHLAIDLLPSKLNEDNNRRLKIGITTLIICFVTAVMIIGGSMLSYITFSQPSPTLDIPMGLVYSIMPISGILILYYKLSDLQALLQPSPKIDAE